MGFVFNQICFERLNGGYDSLPISLTSLAMLTHLGGSMLIILCPNRMRTLLTFPMLILALSGSRGIAGGKVAVAVLSMKPYGVDAKKYSSENFGAGAYAVFPIPQLYNVLAGVVGIEYVNLLSQSFDDVAYVGGVPFPYTQETNQHYFRFYLGPQVGGHGKAFFRPHAGLNFALVHYGISTDVVLHGDTSDIRKNKDAENHVVFGYDLSMGVDLNFDNKISLDGGVKYVKSFSVPQQLGDQESVRIHPQYIQIFLSIGVAFDVFHDVQKDE